jgi:hypothetical protein
MKAVRLRYWTRQPARNSSDHEGVHTLYFGIQQTTMEALDYTLDGYISR